MAIDDIHQTATRDGKKEWQLDAATAHYLEGEKKIRLDRLTMTFFIDNQPPIYLSADSGTLETETRNVMVTGQISIPLMKRTGFKPEFAGAVEAAASTGGAYMPPIMGAGAFLLAELTETSYFTVVKIAVIPAVLYYLSVGLIVYFRAARFGLHGVSADELPPWSRVIPRMHLLLPIPVMEKIRDEFLDFQGMGISIVEISHRAKQFEKVLVDNPASVTATDWLSRLRAAEHETTSSKAP